MSQPHPIVLEELSLDAWFELPEDVPGELVGGRLVEEEVPGFVHEVLVILLGSLFRTWIVPRGGLVAGSEAKFAVAPGRGRKPDLTVFFPGSQRPPTRGLIDVAPDVAVEIVSPTPRDGRRDRVEKLAEYSAFGIHYYWIVDPQLRSLEILELASDGSYRHALGATEGVLETIPGCTGLRLDLDAIWEEIDQVESQP
jgi:Uma2 family endonuclease